MPRRLVVFGDSLAFNGPEGPVHISEPRLYPNALATRLADATGAPWTVDLIARASWSVVGVADALRADMHIQQQVVEGSDAIVFAVGSLDSFTVGLPTPILRRMAHTKHKAPRLFFQRVSKWAHPLLIGVTGQLFRHTSSGDYRRAWRQSVTKMRLLAPEAALCATLPTVHRNHFFGESLRHHEAAVRDTRAEAELLGVAVVDVPSIVAPRLEDLAPDGVHWTWALHDAVAESMAKVLLAQLD